MYDHCNGLLLLGWWPMAVVNPATRQWAALLPPPELLPPLQLSHGHVEGNHLYPYYHLVYDPTAVSPHRFEVFIISELMVRYNKHRYDGRAEWPPSPYTTHVFSSTTWKWEERSFLRQGEPTGTIDDVAVGGYRRGVYFQGALYVHCQHNSVIRIECLSDDDGKYQMIKLPTLIKLGKSYLGKSEQGVYYALLYPDDASCPHLRVWLLDVHRMEWVLRSDVSLQAMENFPTRHFASGYNKPWIVVHHNHNNIPSTHPAQEEDDRIIEFDDNEWDFDDGGVILETKDDEATRQGSYHMPSFLGFHPYKEIALFFTMSTRRVLCYQLNTSKVQELGILDIPADMLETFFLYTPCMLDVGGLCRLKTI
ncbi:uncharacterized protein LOC120666811 [Panicum virgatum]|uniref:uncharacterized protein LOC120666811 n=1 Tax=Panicum virgatum TaxID=38727 RepID=UPI0019D5C6E5|nr:uncharacterized protein LOC120666811 [Panicum virgatum]